jgi:uncharacterized protein (TIGR00269 family)
MSFKFLSLCGFDQLEAFINKTYVLQNMCNNCETRPVFKLHSGEKLCNKHFLGYFEKKVRKTIRVHKLIDSGDKIGVAVSGGKDSLTVLDLLHSIFKNNEKIEFVAILIDEGIEGYRDESIKRAQAFCEKLGVELDITSYKDEYGFKLDDVVEGKKPCSVCGVLRRDILNQRAKTLGVTKLATGHNLDDEAQSIIMNQFRNNIEASARLGPMTGLADNKAFVQRIKPLYFVTEKEVMTYAFLKGIVDEFNECPYNQVSYRNHVREFLNRFEEMYSGTKHAIINSFMETVPVLKEKYKEKGLTLNECTRCSGPTSKDVCQKCVILEQIKP